MSISGGNELIRKIEKFLGPIMRQFTFYEPYEPAPYCVLKKRSLCSKCTFIILYYLRQFHLIIDDVSNVLNDKAQNRSVVHALGGRRPKPITHVPQYGGWAPPPPGAALRPLSYCLSILSQISFPSRDRILKNICFG